MSKSRVPQNCPVCDAPACVHAGHGGPVRRYGWVAYECGRAWHPILGWGGHEEVCFKRRYWRALIQVGHAPTLRKAKAIARAALSWQETLLAMKGGD